MNYFQPNDLNSAFDVLKNNSDLTIAAGCTDLFPVTVGSYRKIRHEAKSA